MTRFTISGTIMMLCFTAGVMLAISFLELIPSSCAGISYVCVVALLVAPLFRSVQLLCLPRDQRRHRGFDHRSFQLL